MTSTRRQCEMSTISVEDSKLLLCELLRFRAALALQRELEELCVEHLHTQAADAKGLFPAAVFEGHQHAAARAAVSPSTVSDYTGDSASPASVRTWVHPIIDVRRGAEVERKAGSAVTGAKVRYTLTGVQYVKGDILAVVEPATYAHMSGESAAPQTISLRDLCLSTPEPFYDDALLPTLEAIEPHHASKNLLDLWLSKLCGAKDKMDSSFNQKRKKAWHLADEATYRFYLARKWLAEQLSLLKSLENTAEAPAAGEVAVTLRTSDTQLLEVLGLACPPHSSHPSLPEAASTSTAVVIEVRWNAVVKAGSGSSSNNDVRNWFAPDPTVVNKSADISWTISSSGTTRLAMPITADAVLRLHRRFEEANIYSSPLPQAAHCFLSALARLLFRYHALSGGQVEKESGWQAAVPSSVMNAFEAFPLTSSSSSSDGSVIPAMSLRTHTVECFASPFNATRRFFFSLFHDTDAVFGSLGNFFACGSAQGCVEAISAVSSEASASSSAATSTTLLQLECNPPFDHEVIAAAFTQLLTWLQTPSPSLAVSVLMIIPDSAQAHAGTVRACAEQSPLCRWLRSLPAHHCLYVHGAQQQTPMHAASAARDVAAEGLPRGCKRAREDAVEDSGTTSNSVSRLVTLSCPTRVFVLQNDTAEKLRSGIAVGEAVAYAWHSVSTNYSP